MKRVLVVLALLLALPPSPRAAVVHLNWTASGDDSLIGRAYSYDLRYSRDSLTAATFDISPRWTWTPPPSNPGARDTTTVTGLEGETRYYFAIKVCDEVQNWCAISNVVSVITPSDSTAPPDTIPRGIILEP